MILLHWLEKLRHAYFVIVLSIFDGDFFLRNVYKPPEIVLIRIRMHRFRNYIRHQLFLCFRSQFSRNGDIFLHPSSVNLRKYIFHERLFNIYQRFTVTECMSWFQRNSSIKPCAFSVWDTWVCPLQKIFPPISARSAIAETRTKLMS